MKRCALLAIVCLLLGSGCSARDVWWNVFGSGYTEGGATAVDRREHYDQQYDAWERSQQFHDPTADD